MYLYSIIVPSIYFLSIIFSLSSNSWILIWLGMEMNLLMFIFIIMKSNMNIMKTESTMKYFLVQSIGSLIFMLTINSNFVSYNEKSLIYAMVPPMALMLKSGMAPFHFWTPQIVSKFSYFSVFLFFTFQKMVPLMIIFSSWFWIIPVTSIINITVGCIGAIKQSSLLKMLLFSSINNIGWMILSMMESMYLFILFFMNYTILSYLMVKIMQNIQIKWIMQIKSLNMNIKMNYIMIIMSMSGYPPFMGFTPKWMIIKYLYETYSMIIVMSIILSSYTLFFYLKSSIVLMTKSMITKKWMINMPINVNIFFMVNMIGPSLFYIF